MFGRARDLAMLLIDSKSLFAIKVANARGKRSKQVAFSRLAISVRLPVGITS